MTHWGGGGLLRQIKKGKILMLVEINIYYLYQQMRMYIEQNYITSVHTCFDASMPFCGVYICVC